MSKRPRFTNAYSYELLFLLRLVAQLQKLLSPELEEAKFEK